MTLENVVFPEEAVSEIPVVILVTETDVKIKSEKNDTIIKLVKERGYHWDYWNKTWVKQITARTGAATERAAEIGNKLLNAGFPILIEDPQIRDKAINGIYEPEHTRWICLIAKGKHEGKLRITWAGKDDELYQKARSLPRSRWDKGVVVEVQYYKEIEDFAELYGFRFSPGARAKIDEYKEQLRNAIRVKPVKIDDVKPADGLKAILQSSNEILPDLIDD